MIEKADAFREIPTEEIVYSRYAVSRAKKWLSDCAATHDCADNARKSGWIPTRLLDVGKAGGPGGVRLVTRDDFKEHDRRYTALSHCWGPDATVVPRTMLATLDARTKELKSKV